MTWSPDGSKVASIGSYGVIKIWDSNREPESLALRGHREAVNSVAWSPDGSRLASGGEDGAIKLWNTTTGREVLSLRGHENWVNSVAWSPSGRHVASGSGDGSIKIWEVATGRELHSLRGDHGGVRCVAFSPDGKQLAACTDDGTIQVLGDLEDFKQGPHIPGSRRCDPLAGVESGWPTPGLGRHGRDDQDLERGHPPGDRRICAISGWVSSLSWSPDGTQLASACGHEIKIWNVTEGRETSTLQRPHGRGHGRLVVPGRPPPGFDGL